MMKEVFFNMISKHTTSQYSTENLWLEIEQNYSEKGRYYHNLQHIENMYSELELCKQNGIRLGYHFVFFVLS